MDESPGRKACIRLMEATNYLAGWVQGAAAWKLAHKDDHDRIFHVAFLDDDQDYVGAAMDLLYVLTEALMEDDPEEAALELLRKIEADEPLGAPNYPLSEWALDVDREALGLPIQDDEE